MNYLFYVCTRPVYVMMFLLLCQTKFGRFSLYRCSMLSSFPLYICFHTWNAFRVSVGVWRFENCFEMIVSSNSFDFLRKSYKSSWCCLLLLPLQLFCAELFVMIFSLVCYCKGFDHHCWSFDVNFTGSRTSTKYCDFFMQKVELPSKSRIF